MSQGPQLIRAIRKAGRRGMSYGEVMWLRISTCPWKRIEEPAAQLELRRRGEKLVKGERDGLVVFRVVRA